MSQILGQYLKFKTANIPYPVLPLQSPILPSQSRALIIASHLQLIDLAAFKDDQKFYFYDDIEHFKDQPHMYHVAYEDDLAVTEEIYSRLTFNNSNIK